LLTPPTDTLPKFRTAGLALSEPEAAVVESAVEVVDSPFALVTPEHPDRIAAENKSVVDINSVKTGAVG
jgi:hypothetical protein